MESPRNSVGVCSYKLLPQHMLFCQMACWKVVQANSDLGDLLFFPPSLFTSTRENWMSFTMQGYIWVFVFKHTIPAVCSDKRTTLAQLWHSSPPIPYWQNLSWQLSVLHRLDLHWTIFLLLMDHSETLGADLFNTHKNQVFISSPHWYGLGMQSHFCPVSLLTNIASIYKSPIYCISLHLTEQDERGTPSTSWMVTVRWHPQLGWSTRGIYLTASWLTWDLLATKLSIAYDDHSVL